MAKKLEISVLDSGNDLTDAELNPVTRFKGQLGGREKLGSLKRRLWRRPAS